MDKRMRKLTATAALGMMTGLLVSIPVAQAWDVTYNFTAEGTVYWFTGNADETENNGSENVSGAVTFKVLSVAPPADADTDGATIAGYNADGWIETEWLGSTSAGAIEPVPIPAGVLVHNVGIHNRYLPETWDYSSQDTVKYYYDTSGTVAFGTRFAGISRQVYGKAPWFTGLNFDSRKSPEYNFFWVADYAIDFSSNHTGYSGSFLIDSWTLASIDLSPLADKLLSVPQGRGLSVLISSVQAYYDAGDMTSACAMLTVFIRQARGLAHNQNLAETAEDAILDAELIGNILECN